MCSITEDQTSKPFSWVFYEMITYTQSRIPTKPNLLCTDIVYKGVVYGTQLAIHFMRKNKVPGGNIISTCSVAGVEPHETYPEYAGAKAAV